MLMCTSKTIFGCPLVIRAAHVLHKEVAFEPYLAPQARSINVQVQLSVLRSMVRSSKFTQVKKKMRRSLLINTVVYRLCSNKFQGSIPQINFMVNVQRSTFSLQRSVRSTSTNPAATNLLRRHLRSAGYFYPQIDHLPHALQRPTNPLNPAHEPAR